MKAGPGSSAQSQEDHLTDLTASKGVSTVEYSALHRPPIKPRPTNLPARTNLLRLDATYKPIVW